MKTYQQPLIDEWPIISFEEIENIEIEEPALRLFYKSFFVVLRLPEKACKAFYALLIHNPNDNSITINRSN